MAIVVEFTIPSDSFPFGRATSGGSDVRVQLERVIPLEESRMPFLWATGNSFDQFERVLGGSSIVKRIDALTAVGDSVLYYVEWYEDGESFLNGVAETGGTIMDAHGDSTWSFTLRFQDHGDLTQFHRFYQEQNFPVHIERVAPLDGETDTKYGFGLTPEQREALLLAVQNGYFSVPREATLEEIADELGITGQAASERVRRGAESVLRKALVGLTPETESPSIEGQPSPETDQPSPGTDRLSSETDQASSAQDQASRGEEQLPSAENRSVPAEEQPASAEERGPADEE